MPDTDTLAYSEDAAAALSAIYALLDAVESGHFYESYDYSIDLLSEAMDGFFVVEKELREHQDNG